MTVALPVQRRPHGPHGPSWAGVPHGAPPVPPQLPAWVRAVPPWVWAGVAIAVVVFFVGLGTYSANAAAAESCTYGSYGRFSVVEDTPACDAATDDRDFGRWLMTIGGAAAIALPVRALTQRRPPAGPGAPRPGSGHPPHHGPGPAPNGWHA